MANLGHRKSLGTYMMGHKKPLGMQMIGYRMPGSEAPVAVMTNKLEQQKKSGGLVKSRRNEGWNSLGGYAGG